MFPQLSEGQRHQAQITSLQHFADNIWTYEFEGSFVGEEVRRAFNELVGILLKG